MKAIVTSILALLVLSAAAKGPKIVIREANGKHKVAVSELKRLDAPHIDLKNAENYELISYDLCLMDNGNKECFTETSRVIPRGARDDIRLLEPGMKFKIRNVMVKDKKTGEIKKVCGNRYKVV